MNLNRDVENQGVHVHSVLYSHEIKKSRDLLKKACYANELLFVLIRCISPPIGWIKNCLLFLFLEFLEIFKKPILNPVGGNISPRNLLRFRLVMVLGSRSCYEEGAQQFCVRGGLMSCLLVLLPTSYVWQWKIMGNVGGKAC